MSTTINIKNILQFIDITKYTGESAFNILYKGRFGKKNQNKSSQIF